MSLLKSAGGFEAPAWLWSCFVPKPWDQAGCFAAAVSHHTSNARHVQPQDSPLLPAGVVPERTL